MSGLGDIFPKFKGHFMGLLLPSLTQHATIDAHYNLHLHCFNTSESNWSYLNFKNSLSEATQEFCCSRNLNILHFKNISMVSDPSTFPQTAQIKERHLSIWILNSALVDSNVRPLRPI